MQPGPQYPYGGGAPPAKKSSSWIIILLVVIVGAVLVLPVLSATAIYGVRRYLASAKTSEAKNTIGAIARGAKQAYERESADPSAPHKLCRSAVTVPAAVPGGRKYQPRTSNGDDFNTGDESTGWKCLKFSITQPIYYQYGYQQGSGYTVGSPDPGPSGFEAVAHGDLDEDGQLSTFTLTGDVTGSEFHVASLAVIQNEFE